MRRRPGREKRVRFVLPALTLLLIAGMLWTFVEGRRARLEEDGLGMGGAGQAPTLDGRGKADDVRHGPLMPSDKGGAPGEAPATRPGHGRITLTVLDWEGRPVGGVLVEVRPRGATFTSLTTDPKGRAIFPEINLGKRCDLRIHPHGFVGARSFHDADWLPRDTTIELERALRIHGLIVDENGLPASDFRVSFQMPGSKQIHDVLMQKDGAFEIGDLPRGALRLWATYAAFKRRYMTTEPPRAAGPIEVEAGTRVLVLEVTRGAVLHVQVENALVDERRGALMATLHTIGSATRRTAEVDLDGHVIFLGLPPSQAYRLTVIGLGRERYVDASGLLSSRAVQVLQSKTGVKIHGRLDVPGGGRLAKGGISARHPTLGAVRGRLRTRDSIFWIEGLPPESEWSLVLHGVGEIHVAGEKRVYYEAKAEARAGEELTLALTEVPAPPR